MRRTLASAIVGAMLFACGAESLMVRPSGPCSSRFDCGFEQTCHQGQCLDTAPGILAGVDVEVTPPASGSSVRTQYIQVDLDTRTETELMLPEPTVFGTLQVLDPQREPIAARLIIRGRGRIPTREIDSQLLLDEDRPTTVKLLPGFYDVRVLPTDAALYPGIEIRSFEVRPGPMIARRELALPSRYRTLTGDVSVRTVQQTKIAGAIVEARSIGSGLPSTRAVTDASGRYSILLPETPDTTFILTATPPAANELPSWSFSQTITFAGNGQREIAIPLEATTDRIRGRVQLRVLGNGEAGPTPVAGARVVLTASTGLDYRTFTAQGVTDDQGFLPLTTMLAASYRVTVEPPVTSRWQPVETALDLTRLENGIMLDKQVELRPKTTVTGVVQSSRGQPVASATVRFEPLSGSPRVASTTTFEDGRYALDLESGEYVVTITPTPNSKVSEPLPVGIALRTVPDGGAPAVELDTIALESGAVLSMVVRAASGEPVPRAGVELFLRSGDLPVSLGRATADDAGRVSLVVPAR